MKQRTVAVFLMISFTAAAASLASAQGMDKKAMEMPKQSPAAVHMGTGVVKSVSRSDGKIVLDHGPISTLSWPAMAMGFKAREKAMLDQVKPGDKVEFTLVQEGKDYVISSIRKAADGK